MTQPIVRSSSIATSASSMFCTIHNVLLKFLLQNLIFRFLQSRQKVQIWLFEQKELRIEGRIIVSVVRAIEMHLAELQCDQA